MKKRLLTAEDLLKLRFVGDPRVSPHKDCVAYVLTEMNEEKDGYHSSIYMTDFNGQYRQLTYHHDEARLIKDVAPRWSSDGKNLAFLSNRTGSNQVWMLPVVEGGEAYPVTSVDGDVKDYAWSPAGDKLALVVEENIERETDSDVRIITRLRYKFDGNPNFLYKRKHIFIYDLNSGVSQKLTTGDFDFYGPSFSPDGNQLVYIGSKDEDQELEYIPSIWQYDLVRHEESLLHKGKGPIRSLSYAPNGKWVGFIGHEYGEHSSANLNVWVISVESKEVRNISGRLDQTVQDVVRFDARYDTGELRVVWNESSSAIYFAAIDKGSIRLYQTNLEGEVSEPLSEGGHTITSFDLIHDDQAILVQAHAHSTGDLVLQNLHKQEDKKVLTSWNDDLFTSVKLSTPETIQFESTDGLTIEGWIMRPVELEEGKTYPLVLQIHGGPHSVYGYGFQHEWQLMTSRGYGVLYLNPRGSQGYGEAFMQKVVGDWGGKDYEDLMNGVDYALSNDSFIDPNNLFVTGASYGGYMTNMITARTQRFKAAATQNAVVNLYSMFGTSDIGFYFNSWQLGGADMWEDEETVMKFSPIRYARDVKTPTLILHNEKDYRCPMEQGEQWYMALRRNGVDTKFIRFPDESHGMASSGKPSHRLERLHHLINWFDQYKN